MSGPTIEVHSDLMALVTAAGDRLVIAVNAAVAARGEAHVVLTGGGAGIGLLKQLRDHAGEVEWSKVNFYWGDERFVGTNDDERNEKQARQALLDHVDIPAGNIHPMAASDGVLGDDLAAAAEDYSKRLAARFGATGPMFDVHLLGMGGEGHVNSLFPNTAEVEVSDRYVVGVWDSPKPPARRITLTLAAIRRARQIWLVVSGEAKGAAVAAAIGGAVPREIPAAGAQGSETTMWLLDEDAASKL
jgi:6-phosphogluconolactonase